MLSLLERTKEPVSLENLSEVEDVTNEFRIGWGHGGSKELLLEVYRDFEPRVRELLSLVAVEELKLWTLLDMDRIPTWHKDRLVLLGDAAHPFLPRKLINIESIITSLTLGYRSGTGRWNCH